MAEIQNKTKVDLSKVKIEEEPEFCNGCEFCSSDDEFDVSKSVDEYGRKICTDSECPYSIGDGPPLGCRSANCTLLNMNDPDNHTVRCNYCGCYFDNRESCEYCGSTEGKCPYELRFNGFKV